MIKQTRLRLALLILCLTAVLSLCACNADMDVSGVDVSGNDTLSRQFLDSVLADDHDAAYGLMEDSVNKTVFAANWSTMQKVMEGAGSYELELTGWNVTRSGGVTACTTTYMLYPDNGRTVVIQVLTRDDTNGIAGLKFNEVTDFIKTTDAYVPVVQIILYVYAALAIGFTVWMLVDCIKRKMKVGHKVLWIILSLLSVAFTLTLGTTNLHISFSPGLFFSLSEIRADPTIQAVITSVFVPVGAIVYFFLRKRLTLRPKTEEATDSVLDTDDLPEASPSSASVPPADGASETPETPTAECEPAPDGEGAPPPTDAILNKPIGENTERS